MKSLMLILVIVISCLLSACSIIPKDKDISEEDYKITPVLELESCQNFPVFEGETLGDLYSFVILDISKQYNECKQKTEDYKLLILNK